MRQLMLLYSRKHTSHGWKPHRFKVLFSLKFPPLRVSLFLLAIIFSFLHLGPLPFGSRGSVARWVSCICMVEPEELVRITTLLLWLRFTIYVFCTLCPGLCCWLWFLSLYLSWGLFWRVQLFLDLMLLLLNQVPSSVMRCWIWFSVIWARRVF